MSLANIVDCHIQPDFAECIQDVQSGALAEETFYINVEPSAYKVDEHRVKVTNQASCVKYDAGEANLFEQTDSFSFRARLDGQIYKFKKPIRDFSLQPETTLTPNITSVGSYESFESPKYALGEASGKITIFNDRKAQDLTLEGHDSDVTTVRFFPSGQVLLSGSADMRLKIWSTLDGSNPRTLTGHTGPVTASAIIDRGRNVLSSSRDGTVKLWECGSGDAIHTFTRRSNPKDAINTMILVQVEPELNTQTNKSEYGTAGKTFLAGHDSGTISYHNIYSKDSMLEIPNQFLAPCRTIATNDPQQNSFTIYAGYENGILAQWDVRNPSKAVTFNSWNKGSAITAMHYQTGRLFASYEADSAIYFDVDSNSKSFSSPTYLVSKDFRIAAFACSGEQDGTIAAGEEGLCALY
ncbi:LANO_0F07096g1_1 [Lachancea nothofagi CBS 11611]|uniref:LANO_0F07096g1_1 n=1 Tax=Lachancea nothofagi CBS 11611 TaxID=1266666 RepID=A0A1G4K8T4_9SACH|nr:LANO_0F07096g1_1 [Lachancea nothofagi CBS 11611]